MSYVQDALHPRINSLKYRMFGDGKVPTEKEQYEKALQTIRAARLPDFNHPDFSTKTPAEMSDEEFEKKIAEMARRDYANGDWASTNPQYMKMKKSYMQVASPDRRSLYSKALASWKMGPNAGMKWNTSVYDSRGNMVGVFDIHTGKWSDTGTPQEAARESAFDSIYISAWRQAKAEHEGKMDTSV
jgi:hypothetical protein